MSFFTDSQICYCCSWFNYDNQLYLMSCLLARLWQYAAAVCLSSILWTLNHFTGPPFSALFNDSVVLQFGFIRSSFPPNKKKTQYKMSIATHTRILLPAIAVCNNHIIYNALLLLLRKKNLSIRKKKRKFVLRRSTK